jgi:hypothetical protein
MISRRRSLTKHQRKTLKEEYAKTTEKRSYLKLGSNGDQRGFDIECITSVWPNTGQIHQLASLA